HASAQRFGGRGFGGGVGMRTAAIGGWRGGPGFVGSRVGWGRPGFVGRRVAWGGPFWGARWRRGWGWGWAVAAGLGLAAAATYASYDTCLQWNGWNWVNACYGAYGYGPYGYAPY